MSGGTSGSRGVEDKHSPADGQFQEVLGGGGPEPAHTEVVDDEQRAEGEVVDEGFSHSVDSPYEELTLPAC